jgi:folate-dependent tRNA-U54 methylase TrmFO/GidA
MTFYETYVTVTYNTPTFNELLRDLSKPSVTAIYDMYTFNTYTRYIKDQCDYANPNMIRQPFTEFIRGISRANMTAMYEMQTFNTYSRYIQDQRD